MTWSKTSPLPPPTWFDEQLQLFHNAAEKAASGGRAEAIRILSTIKSNEMRQWFVEHAQSSGKHRARKLGVSAPIAYANECDPIRSPARYEKLVFERDFYTCRYCGLRLIAKEVLVAFERAVGTSEFRTQGRNEEQHGVVHAFKIVADHVVPHRLRGQTKLENLITACPGCNYGKERYTIEQLGIDDPFDRPPSLTCWDGLTSLLTLLRNNELR